MNGGGDGDEDCEEIKTFLSKFQQACTHIENGNLIACDDLKLEEALSKIEERLGVTHPSTITSKIKFASFLGLCQKWNEAMKLYKECYDHRCASLGEAHELTLGVANNMAVMMSDSGKYEESCALFEDTIKKLIMNFGEENKVTLSTMLNYAQCTLSRGDLSKALSMYSRCKIIASSLLGDKGEFVHIFELKIKNINMNYAEGAEVYLNSYSRYHSFLFIWARACASYCN